MVSPLHSNGRAELRDEKIVTSIGDLAPRPDLRPELLLRLSGKLQTTLELQQLLEIFFDEIQQAILVDGITFHHANNGLHISQGKQSQHSVHYRLQTQGDYMGDLNFHRSTRFREHELANIEGLLTTLVYPVRNALRYHSALAAAFRDPLTGAGNRAALDRTLVREIELSKRHQHALSLLMIDLDWFKQINDKHGHSCGDKVLQQTVECISSCIRQTDMSFRYGGEEFIIVLSGASASGALRIAERIRISIEALRLQGSQGDIQLSASLGCVTLHGDDDKDSLLHRADEALYAAKSGGRNRVICETDLHSELPPAKAD
ncbi:GGDEF domain-containing protein [Bacterioplanes sanyensis]|uniref:diguanylate cyclase n=1 Tax=Bacterioplanes sanyensis TaxID=1249553 RepID=A0A222FNQ3_9GAMM|nr:GGDEF domain-containing protein [Bacterioplanes sanyensis]ASP40399.1 GGDEF domain-containing protein [Bacterioplanes sanyensis]